MRVLLCLSHQGLFRLFESTLRELAERGHEVVVALDSDRYPSSAFAALVAAHENLHLRDVSGVAEGPHAALGRAVRAGSDYVRYLDPRYAQAEKLRARALKSVPIWLRWRLAGDTDPKILDRRLRAIERRLPLDRKAVAFVKDVAPDLVAVSPLFGSPAQLEILRAARALGIPNCLPVASWDNLTNKGLIRESPETLLVWNEAQRDEAVALHGIARERVAVTGAPGFDEWFSRRPSSTREAFTQRLGLRPDQPYLLYLGSSQFIAPDEASFVVDWLREVRADPRLAETGILFRPHPQNARGWERLLGLGDPQIAIHPPPADAPQQTGRADWSREDFYDSMAHAGAAIGVNTTAMIESAVLGRGIYTVLHPRFAQTQGGTLHFEHLRSFAGGLLHTAEDFATHREQLAAALANGSAPDARSTRFVDAFVRPRGRAHPVAPIVADALEAARARAVAPAMVPERPPAGIDALALVARVVELAADPKRRRRQVRSVVRPVQRRLHHYRNLLAGR